MLNIRNFLRFCKQPSHSTIARTSMYFSSSSDDGNKKFPKENSDIESLDDLLNASFNVSKAGKSNVGKHRHTIPKAKHLGQEKRIQLPDEKAPSPQSLEYILKVSYTDSKTDQLAEENETGTKAAAGSGSQSSRHVVEPGIKQKAKIDLAVKKQAHKLSSKELLDRVKRIAKEVAHGAGPAAGKVADELLENLQVAKEDEPVNLNDFTYQKGASKDSSDHSLDLLRNRVVSEEHIYNSADAPWEAPRQRKSSQSGSDTRHVRSAVFIRNEDISLHPKTSLEIFTREKEEEQRTETFLMTFDRLEKRDLWLGRNYAPRNWFEQCIQWTEEGKLWHFPINNEQGLEEEAATVSFTEHIFLEEHLDGWCPTFGPIRHFMELVCIGLSKNPYISVEEKIDNIMWYKQYFDKHRDILEASGTLNPVVTEVPHLEAQ